MVHSAEMFALILPLLFVGAHGVGVYYPGTSFPFPTNYELRLLNASCDGRNTCRRPFNDDMWEVNCQCGPQCVQMGTCCLDAPYAGPVLPYGGGLGCVNVYGRNHNFFMVDKCPIDWDGDDLCTADGEERSDVTLLVPVTSLRTGLTYRNYFCFICNNFGDSEDSFVSWDITYLRKSSTNYSTIDEPIPGDIDSSSLTFDKSLSEWTHPQVPDSYFHLKMNISEKIVKNLRIPYNSNICIPRVVDSCAANWTEPLTRSKCGSYTALVGMTDCVRYGVYRNVHCGICNGADLQNSILCDVTPGSVAYGVIKGADQAHRNLFRYVRPEKKTERPRCPNGQVYDDRFKKCSVPRCGPRRQENCLWKPSFLF